MDALMAAIYDDLQRMARSYLRQQFGTRADVITLEPAALVNESFMRLIRQRARFDNRGHFFSIATKVMFRVLIDYRREKQAAKRGGAQARLTLTLGDREPADASDASMLVEVEQLRDVVQRLETLDPRKADVVRMRVVWGLTVPEIASALDVSPRTVDRDWRFARAWIADEMGLICD